MLHDRWHVTWFVLLPTLLVLLGVLMLIARRADIRSGECAKHRFPTGTPVSSAVAKVVCRDCNGSTVNEMGDPFGILQAKTLSLRHRTPPLGISCFLFRCPSNQGLAQLDPRRSNCNARAQRLKYACAPVSQLTSFCAEKDNWQVDRQPANGGSKFKVQSST